MSAVHVIIGKNEALPHPQSTRAAASPLSSALPAGWYRSRRFASTHLPSQLAVCSCSANRHGAAKTNSQGDGEADGRTVGTLLPGPFIVALSCLLNRACGFAHGFCKTASRASAPSRTRTTSGISMSRIHGPQQSPYEGWPASPHPPGVRVLTRRAGGIFKLELFLPDDYPMTPPKIRFLTKIFHPNVDKLGRICLDVLKSCEPPSTPRERRPD